MFNNQEEFNDLNEFDDAITKFGAKFKDRKISHQRSHSNANSPKSLQKMLSIDSTRSREKKLSNASALNNDESQKDLDTTSVGNQSQKNKVKKGNTLTGYDCNQETGLLMFKRWKKIEEDFTVKVKENGDEYFDISKFGEICDNIKYDMIHYPILREDKNRLQLLCNAQLMCKLDLPFAYGVTNQQKLKIGMKI